MKLDEFNRRFKIVPTPLISWPRDLSATPPGEPVEGDCQDYGKTVKKIEGRFGIMIRCWSKEGNPRWLPRHAVMWIRGKGFIDSTHRVYRRTPLPHIPIWPVGTGFALAVLQTGEGMGWWPGLFTFALKLGVI